MRKANNLWVLLVLSAISCDDDANNRIGIIEKHPEHASTKNNPKKDSAEREYYENGVLKRVTTWTDGGTNSKVEEFDKKGRIEKVYMYKGESLNGETFFYRNGKLLEKHLYVDGERREAVIEQDGQQVTMLFPIFKLMYEGTGINKKPYTSVSFSRKLEGDMTMIIGKTNRNGHVIDTTGVIKADSNGIFRVNPKLYTNGRIHYKIVHHTNQDISIDGLWGNHRFPNR